MKESTVVRARKIQKKLYNMVAVGVVDEPLNQLYDIISTVALLVNLVSIILMTFDNIMARYRELLLDLEAITVAFFAVDYALRILTARYLYPTQKPGRAILMYVFSFSGIIDLLSFFPYYLPVVFPYGAAVFRIIRVARILRLFRINAYYDSMSVITEVLKRKRKQLLSSVFIISVLLLASSLCMYSLEHEAQPDKFSNALSGIWWATSTLLTVGYGDVYPVTVAGKIAGIIISFLGVGMVAIPTGIISAGFVEQYSKLKRMGELDAESDIQFIKIVLKKEDQWVGKTIHELELPHGTIVAAIQRGNETVLPRGNVKLRTGDTIILGAESLKDDQPVDLKEIVINKDHEWNGVAIQDLDISRKSYIIMVNRHGKSLIPRGSLVLTEGDHVIQYTKISTPHYSEEL